MVLRRVSAAAVLGLGALVAGVIGIVSALTPEMANRFQFVRGVLPPGVPEAARVLALAFGIVLIWLAGALVRRRRRAWKLAIMVVLASAAAHLAKGLDFEEAAATLVLLAARWRWRGEFTAVGDPATRWPVAQAVLGLGAVGVLLWLRATDHVRFSERIEEALALIAAALAARALYLYLRPHLHRPGQTPRERSAAEDVVHEQGRDSLAYFALRRDKSYFFSGSRHSFLAYAVVNGSALVSGDPIGEADELPALLADFRRMAHARGWRVAVLNANEELLPLYRRAGFRSIYIGDEAIVCPERFSLEGRPIRKVRQSVHRLAKAGYRVRVLDAGEADAHVRRELECVSAEWRGRWPERGFSMAMDALFAYPEGKIVVAEDPKGRVGGFIQLVPSPASGSWSLSTMRRRRETPNGLMEFLIVETLAWGKEHGVSELSLNFSLFGRILRGEGCRPRLDCVLRFTLLKLDRFFQVERLHSFNRKFFPEWRPRYLCFERYADLPVVGLAYAHVEGFVTPPGPWSKTPDLTAA